MSVKINIFYPQLREFINNQDLVEVNGNTVAECLDDLIKQYPGVDKLIFDERGQLLRKVFVFVNEESTHKVYLNQPVKEGDDLIIAVLLAAG